MKQSNILKKPSQFKKAPEKESAIILQSPALFVSDDVTMKKPSDFYTNLPDEKSETATLLKLLERRKEEKSQFVVSPTTNVHSQLYKNKVKELENYLTFEKNLTTSLKEQLEVERSEHKALEQQLKNELIQVKKDFCDFKRSFDNDESRKFLEMKSIYEKYISLQTQFDRERYSLEEKLTNNEKKVAQLVREDKENDKTLQKEISVRKSLEKKICEKEIECTLFTKKYEEEILELRTRVQNSEGKNSELIKVHDEMKERERNLEHLLREKSSCIEQMVNEKEQFTKTSKTQKDFIIGQEKQIQHLESQLGAEINKKECLEIEMNNKRENIAKLKATIQELRTQQENSTIELKNIHAQGAISKIQLEQYQKTCNMLQAANKQANVRIETLEDMMKIQELTLTGLPGEKQNQLLLETWRKKVYQVLVLLKASQFEK